MTKKNEMIIMSVKDIVKHIENICLRAGSLTSEEIDAVQVALECTAQLETIKQMMTACPHIQNDALRYRLIYDFIKDEVHRESK